MDANTRANERKRRIEKYFRRTPDPSQNRNAMIRLGIGISLAIIGLIVTTSNWFIAIIMLAIGLVQTVKGIAAKSAYDKAYSEAEPKPTDAEVDALLADDLYDIEAQAMKRLGLTAEDLELGSNISDPVAALIHGNGLVHAKTKSPLVVFGPIHTSPYAIGRDGVWRFQRYEVMVICPTGYHLGLYRGGLDLLTGGLQAEETQEYHYADVVAVSTKTTPVGRSLIGPSNRDGEEKEFRFATTLVRQFQIVVSSGDRSEVVVGISDEKDPTHEATLHDSGIEDVIGSLRKTLRDKKGGAHVLPGL